MKATRAVPKRKNPERHLSQKCRAELDSAREFIYIAAVRNGAQVAQLVEQRTENPRVGGSNPPLGTTFPKNLV
jgi:hypothetical protein